jgi:hypothetical protein
MQRKTIDKKNPTVPEVADDATEKCIIVTLRVGGADLGSVAYRLAFLKEHKIRFLQSDGNYGFCSDGHFAEKASKLTNASVKEIIW